MDADSLAVRNWKRRQGAHDGAWDATAATAGTRRASNVGAESPSLGREHKDLDVELACMRAGGRSSDQAGDDALDSGVGGKDEGTDPNNPANSEQTRLVLHLAEEFDLRPWDLLHHVGITRNTFYHNVKRIERLTGDEWLLEPVVCAALEQSHERYGYRMIWHMLREKGIMVCAKRVIKVMSNYGITL